jgi:hypothetical protein
LLCAALMSYVRARESSPSKLLLLSRVAFSQ